MRDYPRTGRNLPRNRRVRAGRCARHPWRVAVDRQVCGAARLELTSGSQRTDAHAFYKACGYGDGTVRFIKRLGAA